MNLAFTKYLTGPIAEDTEKDRYIKTNSDALFSAFLYRSTLFGALLFLLLSALDYMAVPLKFPLFFMYRIATALFLVTISFLSRQSGQRVYQYTLAFMALAASAAAVELMILKSGGHQSAYYPGMALLGICVIGFNPVGFSFQVSSALIIYSAYLFPILVTEKITDPKLFFISNFFILSSLLAAIFFGHMNFRRLMEKLGLSYELDASKVKLKEHALELQALVDARTAELVQANRELGIEVLERRRTEEELQKSREQLRNLFARVQAIREEERTRIAHELHDELGQILTALKMDISLLRASCKDHTTVLERSQSMMKVIDETITTVRRILSELRPGILDHLGLVAAIEWQAKEFQSRTAIRCKWSIDPPEISVDQNCSTILFRILQEALANAARHSDATRIHISLKESRGRLVLSIRDNGKGITEEEINDPLSLGLAGIHEGVRLLGGTVSLKGTPQRGTTLKLTIPLQQTMNMKETAL